MDDFMTGTYLDNAIPTEHAERSKSSRRKACDLCFTKKIKCDMLKPVCSNCRLYKAQCRTSSIRRKANPPRPRPAMSALPTTNAPSHQSEVSDEPEQPARQDGPADQETLEERMARVERNLQQILEIAAAFRERDDNPPHEQRQPSADSSERETPNCAWRTRSDGHSPPAVFNNVTREHHAQTFNVNTANYDSAAYKDPGPFVFGVPEAVPSDPHALPPLQELLPVVDHYFSTFNTVMPLFHQQSFMRMLNSWFAAPSSRHKAAWAAIHIVAAIGMRVPRKGVQEPSHDRVTYANCCLRNAQSVVSELVSREEDLLGIQVLLGIVVLFRNSSDQRPASVIIATAMRLAHRLQLHASSSDRYYSPEENEQRARVFWIAYSLDKSISLRTRTPSVQLDIDIDISLPASVPKDGVGLLWTLDRRYQLNYHRQRTELAHIEGKVFDLLYSNRAAKVKGSERRRTANRLTGMLEAWYQRMPAAFHVQNVLGTLGTWEILEMTKLLHTYVYAFFMSNGLFSHNSEWAKQLSSTGRAAVLDLGRVKGMDGNLRIEEHEAPPLAMWTKFVQLSRGCMKLFQWTMPTECLVWQCSCAHFCSLLVLLVNICMHPSDASVAQDQVIINKAVHYVDKSMEIFHNEACRALQSVVHELHQKAMAAAQRGRTAPEGGIRSDAEMGSFYGPVSPLLDEMGTPALDSGSANQEPFSFAWDAEPVYDSVFDVLNFDSMPNPAPSIAAEFT